MQSGGRVISAHQGQTCEVPLSCGLLSVTAIPCDHPALGSYDASVFTAQTGLFQFCAACGRPESGYTWADQRQAKRNANVSLSVNS